MKKIVCRRDTKCHLNAAWRIMFEVLDYIPYKEHIMVLIQQDIIALLKNGAGTYYVTKDLPANANVKSSEVHHYFYLFRIFNDRKKLRTYLVPRLTKCPR